MDDGGSETFPVTNKFDMYVTLCGVGMRNNRRLQALRHEWNEAPWFVLLVIAVSAFVGPMLIFGAWNSIRGLF